MKRASHSAAPGLMTIREAAAFLSVCPATVRAALKAGLLQSVQAPGTSSPRGRRITRASLEAYLARPSRLAALGGAAQ